MAAIGVDIDDVLFPWSETAFGACLAAGLVPPGKRLAPHWEFWRGWGCEADAVWEVLNEATLSGRLYLDPAPYFGALEGMERLLNAGHDVRLVTARGFKGPLSGAIREQTVQWLTERAVPHSSLTFSEDKTVVYTDWFIDDSVRNYEALRAAGVKVRLLNRPHNTPHADGRDRVAEFGDFVDEVLGS